jgi:hypothetical protein
VAAALLALSLAVPAAAQRFVQAPCCCHHAEEDCRCPVCEHARELKSGQRHFKTCGSGEGATAAPALPDALPVPPSQVARAAPAQPAALAPAAPHEPPQPEVPTPPPLA